MDHPPPPPPPQPPPPPPSYTCTNWCNSKAAGFEPPSQKPIKTLCPAQTFNKLLDGAASWLASAFFTSLERFSCIIIDTKDEQDDSHSHLPLVGADGGQVPLRDGSVEIIEVFEVERNSEASVGQEVHIV